MSDNCPVCGGLEFNIKGKAKTNPISVDFIDKDYNVVQCKKCSLYYVFPDIEFSDEQWSKLYNSEYFPPQPDWLLKKRREELKYRFDKTEHFLRDKENIKFLDIGAGGGGALIEGARRGYEVTGIDIVDNRTENAKADGIKFIKGKFLEHQFSENSFDFIYLDSVLEHVPDPAGYLLKIKKILKPDGILYIAVPNEDSLFNDVRRLIFALIGRRKISEKLKPFDSPYHIIGFNTNSFQYLMEKTGLNIKSFRILGRKCEFLGCSPFAKGFWINLVFLFPIEILGYLLKRDVYFEAFLHKSVNQAGIL